MQLVRNQRGDSLVEVLLATAIFSLVVASTTVIMSHGMSATLAAAERTEVQAIMAGQAAALRAAHATLTDPDDPKAEWQGIIGNLSTPDTAASQVCNSSASNRFYFNPTATGIGAYTRVATTGATISTGSAPTPGTGLWVEAYRPGGGKYYDFYIKACWEGPGSSGQQELKSIVRLYAN